jgi:hypothetical protein
MMPLYMERSAHPDHIATVSQRANGEWEVNCTCGARWTHASTATDEKMQAIFGSHCAYAKRIATRVD